ncbi:unnamed protein product [Absidia cylindrospora]
MLNSTEALGKHIQVICHENQWPFARVLIAPIGTISSDIDDARQFKDAAFQAGKRALEAGFVNPFICFADAPVTTSYTLNWTFDQSDDYKSYLEVTMLGFLETCYEPVDVRDHYIKTNTALKTFTRLSFAGPLSQEDSRTLVRNVHAIEQGRRVSKDIGSPDPEQMSPIQIVKYLEFVFRNDQNVKMTMIDDIDVIGKEYPLALAVSRASLAVPRHQPRFVFFEYKSTDQTSVKENLYFVGKGVTYDTGGADIKCSGHMRGCLVINVVLLLLPASSRPSKFFNPKVSMPLLDELWCAIPLVLIRMLVTKLLYPEMVIEF